MRRKPTSAVSAVPDVAPTFDPDASALLSWSVLYTISGTTQLSSPAPAQPDPTRRSSQSVSYDPPHRPTVHRPSNVGPCPCTHTPHLGKTQTQDKSQPKSEHRRPSNPSVPTRLRNPAAKGNPHYTRACPRIIRGLISQSRTGCLPLSVILDLG